MKINLHIPETEKQWVRIEDQSIKLYNKTDITILPGDKVKLSWDIKLELHLRNSEVVGIPIINQSNKLNVISSTLYKPLVGTHDGLYLTVQSNSIDEISLLKSSYIGSIKFISKLYWIMLMKKNIDGIMSVPININLI